jgi:hypothetical protein
MKTKQNKTKQKLVVTYMTKNGKLRNAIISTKLKIDKNKTIYYCVDAATNRKLQLQYKQLDIFQQQPDE